MDKVGKITTTDPKVEKIPPGVRNPIHVVLDNIRSAYNVGSAFRTADAVCAQKIYLCGISAYPPHTKIEKTALGSTESVPWQYYGTTREAVLELKAQNIPVCLIELTTKSVSFWDYHFPQPVGLVFGNELYGIEDEVFPLADAFISIPMYGKKMTLNVSTTLGIILFEAVRSIKFPSRP